MLKSEFLVLAQATSLPHLLLRLLLLLRQLRVVPQPQLLHRQAYHLHHLRLLQAVPLLTVLVDQIILAPMECAAASGAIVVPQKHTVESAVKATAAGSHLRHLVHAHRLQVLQQPVLPLLLGLTTMLTTEKIVVSSHMLGTGKLVPPMSKLMLIRIL